MHSDAAVVAYRANVVEVVDMVFRTMLGLKAEPYPMPWVRPPDMITAAVYFAGAWRGAVLLECTPCQARTFAQLLMSVGPAATVDDDVRDALGELANMLAGNLKPVLPGGVVLSMPSVIEGSGYSLQICGNRSIERVPFWTIGDIFGVTLVEMLGAEDRETSANWIA
ncbi:MAG: chemotaxis protein CheX [Bryobacteraceae bacterium]